MHFEGRELNENAEPITERNLHEGRVYFSLQFADDALLVPIVEPLIFLCKTFQSGNREHLLLFQNFESYCQGLRIDSADNSNRRSFQKASADGIKHIFEYENALNLLIICSMRRRTLKTDE